MPVDRIRTSDNHLCYPTVLAHDRFEAKASVEGKPESCAVQIMLRCRVGCFQGAQFLLQARQLGLLAGERTLCVVDGLGKGKTRRVELIKEGGVLLCGGNGGGSRRRYPCGFESAFGR